MGLKLNGATSGSIELDVPDDIGSDLSLTLPDGVGSAGQVLKNGSTAGTLEFANGGKILQVKQTVLKSRQSQVYTSSYVSIPNFSVSITPSSSSSKVLVYVMLALSSAGNYGSANIRLARTVGGTTENDFFIGETAGNRFRGTAMTGGPQFYIDGTYGPGICNINYLDSPATTNTVTYGIQIQDGDTADTIYINAAPAYTSDSGFYGSLVSSIIAMEVAA